MLPELWECQDILVSCVIAQALFKCKANRDIKPPLSGGNALGNTHWAFPGTFYESGWEQAAVLHACTEQPPDEPWLTAHTPRILTCWVLGGGQWKWLRSRSLQTHWVDPSQFSFPVAGRGESQKRQVRHAVFYWPGKPVVYRGEAAGPALSLSLSFLSWPVWLKWLPLSLKLDLGMSQGFPLNCPLPSIYFKNRTGLTGRWNFVGPASCILTPRNADFGV